jgi:hypothetical protein
VTPFLTAVHDSFDAFRASSIGRLGLVPELSARITDACSRRVPGGDGGLVEALQVRGRRLGIELSVRDLRAADDTGDHLVIVPQRPPPLAPRAGRMLLEILMEAAERRGGRDDSPPAWNGFPACEAP